MARQMGVTLRRRLQEQTGVDPYAEAWKLVYLQNKTLVQAGKRFGVNRVTIHRWLRRYDAERAQGTNGTHAPASAEAAS